MPSIRESEPAFLVAAARKAVDRSNLRAVAAQAGLSPAGLARLLGGGSQWIYGSTVKKLRAWYWSRWAAEHASLTPDAAPYVLDQLFMPLDAVQRAHGLAVLVRTVEQIFDRGSIPLPVWLIALTSAVPAAGGPNAG